MFKKTLAMLAALTMCASLAACGDSDSSAANSTADTTSATTTTTAAEDKESEADTTTTTTTTAATTTPAPEPVEPSIKFDPEATETVITIDDPITDDWQNPMGEDYIDARTFAEGELTVTVEISLTEDTVKAADKTHQIAFAPAYSDTWDKIGGKTKMISAEFPVGADLAEAENLSDGTYTLLKDEEGELSEDVYLVSDNSKLADLYIKPDGFIKFSPEVWTTWKADETQTVTFKLSADAVKTMINRGTSGMLFQCSGGFKVNKITLSCGNILTKDQYNTWLEEGGEDGSWRK